VRLVLDTSVVVAAIRSRTGASSWLLGAALKAQFPFLISTALVLEYEAVLTRPENLKAAGITALEAGEILDALCDAGIEVQLTRRVRPRLRDPNDEMVLETAVNGNATAIVTFNQRDFADIARDFGILVLAPSDVLKTLRIMIR
jgi:putative PIN family toxin of toxin-antitoxin system